MTDPLRMHGRPQAEWSEGNDPRGGGSSEVWMGGRANDLALRAARPLPSGCGRFVAVGVEAGGIGFTLAAGTDTGRACVGRGPGAS